MMTMAERSPSKPATQLKRFEFPVDDDVINGFLDAQVSRSFPTTMRSLVYLFVKEHGYVDVLGLVGSMFNEDVDDSGHNDYDDDDDVITPDTSDHEPAQHRGRSSKRTTTTATADDDGNDFGGFDPREMLS